MGNLVDASRVICSNIIYVYTISYDISYDNFNDALLYNVKYYIIIYIYI